MGVILEALLLDIPEALETARLWVRATRAGAGVPIREAVLESHEQLREWMPWAREVPSPEESEKYCREMQARWHARQELDFCFWQKADGRLVGKGGLHTIDWTVPKLEIGYWIRTSFARQGYATEAAGALVSLARAQPVARQGYATEAAGALVSLARDRLGARRLEITSDTRNIASRRVAEKCGFALEGVRRQSRRDVAGELADSCMYGRTF